MFVEVQHSPGQLFDFTKEYSGTAVKVSHVNKAACPDESELHSHKDHIYGQIRHVKINWNHHLNVKISLLRGYNYVYTA